MSNLVDFDTLPVVDVWGDAVRARRVEGERITLALVELAPDALVPGHQHEHEQLGMVITGQITFTVGDEIRELAPGASWRIPSNVWHQVQVGPDGAMVIDIFAPTRRDWDDRPSHPPSAAPWPGR